MTAPDEVLLEAVEDRARELCSAVHAATDGGVSTALLLPSLLAVFKDAGMLPADLNIGSLMGMLG